MKIKRYKKAEKFMSLYKNNFGFREPYQILLDGTFCQVALSHKVNIQEQLPRYLSGQCKLLTTACVIEETKKLGKPLHGACLILSQFPLHNCGHESPISASKCLSSFIIDSNNRDHYLVATQDHKLRLKLAKSVTCPLIKLANNSLVLEKPTEKSQDKVNRTHHYIANRLKDDEREKLITLNSDTKVLDDDSAEKKKKKRKGIRGPNPLSCKKKSKKPTATPQQNQSCSADEEKPKRRRHKIKKVIPRHVKRFLEQNEKIN